MQKLLLLKKFFLFYLSSQISYYFENVVEKKIDKKKNVFSKKTDKILFFSKLDIKAQCDIYVT